MGFTNSGTGSINSVATAFPTTAASRMGTASSDVNFLLITSMLNIAPPMGALKVAAIPEATPQQVSTFKSRADSLMALPMAEPAEAPIRAMGPSRPALPPLPRVIAEVKMRTRPARFLMSPVNLCRAIMI
ncbi:MAG: hypothetical protein A4E43_01001 [Methanosaeta sp. PtaB.Bin005]|nr:MAG: hypothetical protein A4E43_01001 [Methanosaeta sp. PtaB.Bin005]